MEEKCKSCKYLEGKFCRRFPDQPRKNGEEWCGEWVKSTKVAQEKDKEKK